MTQRITTNNNNDIQYTNFEKAKEFSRSFEVPHFDTPQSNIFTQNPELVKSHLDLINEKVDELTEAIREHNMVKVVDALANILYVVYGAGYLFGLDLDSAYDIVHKSNMSKNIHIEFLNIVLNLISNYLKGELLSRGFGHVLIFFCS